jgi:hypothetical protein
MATNRVEERLTALEKEVAELRRLVQKLPIKDWRSTIGIFSGDSGMREIFEEGMKIREKDREKARKHYARLDEAKKRRAEAKKRQAKS